MGIQGLIPLLEKSWNTINVSQFSGCTVAIDAYCWLHKGVFTCADKLARGEDNQAYVHYCMRFVLMLLAKNIKPILVFDGQSLPAKADTESKRRKLRDENRKKAAELLRLGKTIEASSLLKRSVDVTHQMALNLIKRCREINVDCIVAPYEADSQLAYLNISDIAHLVITEDSDLLLFGCKRVLFKMDQNGGGILIEQEKLYLSMNMPPEQFNFNKFRYMCILSGCDYLPSVPGVGLIKARQFITRISEPDIYKSLLRLGSFMNIKVPSNYRDQFMDADRMFQYQPVYDPLSRQIKPLNEISDPNLSLLVSKLNPDQAYQLALGNVDPMSLNVMDNWDPDVRIIPKNNIKQACHQSIWSKNYQPSKFKIKPTSCRPNIVKNVTQTSPKCSSQYTRPEPKKRLPVTEDDVLSTLEEIYTSEKIAEENETKDKKFKKSVSEKHHEIIDKHVLTSEIDDIIVEKETPNIFKQSTKRKYTVINPEEQVVSRYFSGQIPKSNAINDDDEKECINPFKCRKIVIPQNIINTSDDVNITSSSIHSVVEDDEEKECINPFKCHKAIIPQKREDANDDLNIASSSTHLVVKDDEKECINPFKCNKVIIPQKREDTSDDLSITSSSTHLVVEDDERECINPFKCHKVVIPQKGEDTSDNLSVISSEENKTQDEKIDKEVISNKFCIKTPSSIHKAFFWSNFSNSTTKTKSGGCDDINNKWISQNTRNESNSIHIDCNKTDNDNDVDEGFYSQTPNESNVTPKESNGTSNEKKRSCPRTGLSKNAVKKGQTLLSKFGFKTSEQLKR